MRLRYTERSADDPELAFSWYERQRRGLGFEFPECVEAALQNIMSNPEMYQKRYSNFRGCVVRKFPFVIFYTTEPDETVIHSVFDNRQEPQKRPQ